MILRCIKPQRNIALYKLYAYFLEMYYCKNYKIYGGLLQLAVVNIWCSHYVKCLCNTLGWFTPRLQNQLDQQGFAISWWRHQMETFSALLAICAGNSPVPGEFPIQRPVTRSFDVYFDLRPNKRLSKQSLGWWFETLSPPLWRHCNAVSVNNIRIGTSQVSSTR